MRRTEMYMTVESERKRGRSRNVLEVQFSSRSDGEPRGSLEVSSKLDGFNTNERDSATPEVKTRRTEG